ncbi:MAG: flagellar biosynthetic protein FliR [Gammaproteobacteria bacterium]|nr:flagellar biosynthetic protein FliR [Gammaproteobacteria bacterium]
MHFTDAELLALLQHWIYPLLRVAGVLMAAPIIGTRTVPGRVRIIMTLSITAVMAPVLPVTEPIALLSGVGLATAAQQVLIGVAIGMVIRLMFTVLEMAGQVMAQQMGLGFASLVDPQSGAQVPVVSQFYIVFGTLMFLSLDGHLLLIEALYNSFSLIPVGGGGIGRSGIESLLEWSSQLFAMSLAIALPVIIALLVVNIALGVMARAAPQLNIFAVGFPVMIMFGIALIMLTFGSLTEQFGRVIELSFEQVYILLRGR